MYSVLINIYTYGYFDPILIFSNIYFGVSNEKYVLVYIPKLQRTILLYFIAVGFTNTYDLSISVIDR